MTTGGDSGGGSEDGSRVDDCRSSASAEHDALGHVAIDSGTGVVGEIVE